MVGKYGCLCVDTHHCLSCLPLMFCSLNLNNMWVCVGSVTHKKHGRMPGEALMRLAATVVWMTHLLAHVGVNPCPCMLVFVCVCKHMNVEDLLGHTHYTIHVLCNYKMYMKCYNCSSRDVTRDKSHRMFGVSVFPPAAVCWYIRETIYYTNINHSYLIAGCINKVVVEQ